MSRPTFTFNKLIIERMKYLCEYYNTNQSQVVNRLINDKYNELQEHISFPKEVVSENG